MVGVQSERRTFSSAVSFAFVGNDRRRLVRTVSPAVADTKTDLIANMKWMNEPASWKRSGDRLLVRSRAKTDFWRKTFYGYITDNGHFFYVPVSGDFVFQVRVNGEYAALYDQAGLMVRQNAENWVKCGTEFFDGQRHASVVFTRDFSDWSTMPDLSKTAPIWWRAVRKKDSIETLCSLDGNSFTFGTPGIFRAGSRGERGHHVCRSRRTRVCSGVR
jgi:regulation of enolase protein 1 (concanavalin A-like superfamily)